MNGYILLRVQSGFNDGILLIDKLTPYALKYKRTIILTFEIYRATKLDSIFDFSNYPVPIICGDDIVPSLKYTAIEPSCYGMNPYTPLTSRDAFSNKLINGMPTQFNINKEYPATTLLIWDSVGCRGISMFQIFKNIRLTPEFLIKFKKQRELFPAVFNAIHVRGTDDPEKNTEKTMKLVNDFVVSNPVLPIYLATDDMSLLDDISSKHSLVVKPLSCKKIVTKYYSLHHSFGNTDPECLSDAIVDLLMCASANKFQRSTGGFSGLMEKFHENPGIVNKLLEQ